MIQRRIETHVPRTTMGLPYDTASDTDEFGMKRASMSSINSETAFNSSAPEVAELRNELVVAKEATAAAEARVSVLDAELQRFKDQHAFVSASKEAVQQQLREETIRREAAEEKVELLRGQVEQARRSVMQLQKQEQERAAATARAAAAATSSLADGTELPSNTTKRTSSGLYGRGRPPSTQSATSESAPADIPPPPPVPASGLRELRLGGNARSQSVALRVATDGSLKSPRAKNAPRSPSATTATTILDDEPTASPVAPAPSLSSSGSPPTTRTQRAMSIESPRAALLEATQGEVLTLRQQLESLSIQYAESEEARLASESCVKALREFIATDPQDAGGISLPPLPTEDDDVAAPSPVEKKEGEAAPEGIASKWGFGGLWGKAPATSPAPVPAPAAVAAPDDSPRIAVTPPDSSPALARMTSPPSHPESVDEDQPITPEAPTLGQSLSSFFGRRRAMSKGSGSTASSATITSTPPMPTPAGPSGLGLHLDQLNGVSLPLSPSATDEIAEATAPPTPPRNIRRTPSPRIARAISPIAESPASPVPEKAVEIEAEEDKPSSPQSSRADSPPAASVTTLEDDLATPADSPLVGGAEFGIETAVADDAEGEDTKAADETPAPSKPPRASGRRGKVSKRGRGTA
jgi:hypothetical protein